MPFGPFKVPGSNSYEEFQTFKTFNSFKPPLCPPPRLGSGTKKRQQEDIRRVQILWADYRQRKKEEK